MKWTLIAKAPDGWALVRQGVEQWLITPPYTADHIYPQPDREVARALTSEDFQLDGRHFDDLGTLCKRITDERIAQARAEERAGKPEQLLRHASREQAQRHLRKLEGLLEAGPKSGIRKALNALRQAEAVIADPVLMRQTEELIRRYDDLRNAADPPDAGRDA